MIDDTYLSIKEKAEGLYKEKGSKFISFAFPVDNEEAIKSHLENIKKEYYDARHHCYAYRVGKDGETFRANDAGEPNHSAGDPILGQIRSSNLTNILIIVVRYFGGTKLGVGGLINAYRTAAAEVIRNSTVIKKISTTAIKVEFEYLSMNDVMKLIKDYEAEIEAQDFGNSCEVILSVRRGFAKELLEKLRCLENVTASLGEP